MLVEKGFPEHSIRILVREKATQTARHTCQLADLHHVDAVVVEKRSSSALEAFLRDDSSSALLHHCSVSPVWFCEGTVDSSRAAICIGAEQASVRAADHAAFMLANTQSRIDLVYSGTTIATSCSSSFSDLTSELVDWRATKEGNTVWPYLSAGWETLRREGIEEERVTLTVLRTSGPPATTLLDHCRLQQIGIMVLGHSAPRGVRGFLQGSVTRKILDQFKDMAVWVCQ
jgi:nucleotide-binding universal stress UspA family protein